MLLRVIMMWPYSLLEMRSTLDIESLDALLEPIRRQQADLVIGSRFIGDK